MVYSKIGKDGGLGKGEMALAGISKVAVKHRELMVVLLVLAGLSGLVVGLYRMRAPGAGGSSFRPMLAEGVQVALSGPSRITSTAAGKLAWSMSSQGLEYFRERGLVAVTEPSALIPLADGGTVEVRGRQGRYYQSAEDIGLEHEVQITLTRGGRREWVLMGDTASYRKVENAFYIGGLHGTLYPETGDTVGLRGGRGRYDVKTRTMALTERVFCRWSQGMVLTTEKLNYATDTTLATTDSPVVIEGQGFRLTGLGLEANLKTQQVVIPADVGVVIRQGVGGR